MLAFNILFYAHIFEWTRSRGTPAQGWGNLLRGDGVLLGRPERQFPDELMFYPWCISFFRHSFSEVPRPIAMKLCNTVEIWLNFIIPLQNSGDAPQKNLGPKHAKFR